MQLSPRVTHNNPCTLRSRLIWLGESRAGEPCVSKGFSYAVGQTVLATQAAMHRPWRLAVSVVKGKAAWPHNQQGPSQTRATSQPRSSCRPREDSAKEISNGRRAVTRSSGQGSVPQIYGSGGNLCCWGSICRCVIWIIGRYCAADIINKFSNLEKLNSEPASWGHNLCTGLHTPKGSELGWMQLSCYHLKILNNFFQRGLVFLFCAGPKAIQHQRDHRHKCKS